MAGPFHVITPPHFGDASFALQKLKPAKCIVRSVTVKNNLFAVFEKMKDRSTKGDFQKLFKLHSFFTLQPKKLLNSDQESL